MNGRSHCAKASPGKMAKPSTADDVVFTIQTLIDNAPELAIRLRMKQWVKSVEKIDDLNCPSSR
jgi:ABC-type transport system substrate-binding protein